MSIKTISRNSFLYVIWYMNLAGCFDKRVYQVWFGICSLALSWFNCCFDSQNPIGNDISINDSYIYQFYQDTSPAIALLLRHKFLDCVSSFQ